MRIGRLLLIFLVGTLLLAGAVMAEAILLRGIEREVEAAQQRRHQSYKLADELHQSSDDLTRFARTYAVTGDTHYRDYYWKILDIRNGKSVRPEDYGGVYWDLVIAKLLPEPPEEDGAMSLEARMVKAGFTVDEFNKLKQAQNRSDELVRLEEVAMNAVEGRFDDGTGTFSKEGPPDQALASQILHDARYHAAKANIMQPIGEFLAMVDERTEAELSALNRDSSRMLLGIICTSTLLLVLIGAMAWVLRERFLRPSTVLMATVEKIGAGDLDARTNVSGTDEMGVLGKAIDSMASRLTTAVANAEQKAEEAQEQARALAEERHHSEKLLHNILPAIIAERLQKGESLIAETYPEVTVLFADIVGFTKLAAQLGPRETVSMLNDVFGRFDELVVKFKLEKIKTIGDCYMVVAGVPARSPTHCQQVARFSLAALKSFEVYAAAFSHPLRIRVGMHTGTVVAGIVGTQKFAYDLWGDVVNVASRYETTGTPNKIHVSDAVRVRLEDDFVFEDAGEVDLKGKGMMRSWFLVGDKEGAAEVIELKKKRN
ncbi:adenylate/guanylate cyclase domain-containing protein [Methyloceanibacter sp.]|uniref:adenylate/guanylate cyclase domain-containing protein n=1 Tax=Methyloceanibacter sp. TaxID=1965321 RepID=UPI002BFE460E|nr:adenylate/guanylate cyclase domain-containing protein [Methyloceanibacter sp.]HML93045.1 adenylate/guanylate cyclase domain-containing protein [Methyloceanibacter sp.]